MEKKNYIYGLETLRALAITGVTLFHFFPNIFKGGYLGVCLFFVLTGFLLSVTSRKHFNVFQFYWKRIKRIYPSLLIVIFVTCAICYIQNPSSLSGMKEEVLSILLGYNNWWQIQVNADYFSKAFNVSPFTHFWFLGIELQYYLIWPILFLTYIIGKKTRNLKYCRLFFLLAGLLSAASMFFLYSPGVDVTPLYYGTHTRIFSLLLGSLLGFLYSKKKEDTDSVTKILHSLLFTVSIVCTLFGYFMVDGQSAFLYKGGMFLFTILFMYQVYCVTNPNYSIGILLEKLPIQWLGKHSFGIYLWQYPVIFFFSSYAWAQSPIMKTIEIGITILLAYLLDSMINLKNINSHKILLIPALATSLCMCFGGYELFTSTNEKQEAMEKLQKKLEENAKKIEEQKEEVLETVPEEIVEEEITEFCSTDRVLLIGDSILLTGINFVYEEFPNCVMDAQISRSVDAALPLIQEYDSQGLLHNTVVIALGTNAPMYSDEVEAIISYLGEDRDIFWVNVADYAAYWIDSNNAYINELANTHPNIHVVDWIGLRNEHPEILEPDFVHPTEPGSQLYVQLIKQTIENTPSIRYIKSQQ